MKRNGKTVEYPADSDKIRSLKENLDEGVGVGVAITFIVAKIISNTFNSIKGRELQAALNKATPQEIETLKRDYELTDEEFQDLKEMKPRYASRVKRLLDRMKKRAEVKGYNNSSDITQKYRYSGFKDRVMNRFRYS